MEHQKAVYLQEMGITQWKLRRPQLFSNCPSVKDISHAPLLVICSKPDITHRLMAKILSAFNVSVNQVQYFSMQAFENHQGTFPTLIWSTLGQVSQLQKHHIITSPPLAQLSQDPLAKKSLWEQFCAYNKQKK